jgi:enamine deaminase RidA (YjgF/YER057c/UK114 family)
MAGQIEAKLAELGITLPPAPAPAAAYVPYVKSGDLVFISGQVSVAGGRPITGKLGDGASVDDGQAAAKVCALNLLAQLKAACDGDLDRLVRVVKLTGFVNCTADFVEQHLVINGASNFLGEVLGERGAHARAAVGAPSLPLGVMVEIEGIFEIR